MHRPPPAIYYDPDEDISAGEEECSRASQYPKDDYCSAALTPRLVRAQQVANSAPVVDCGKELHDPLMHSLNKWYHAGDVEKVVHPEEDMLQHSLGQWYLDGQRAPDARTNCTEIYAMAHSTNEWYAAPEPFVSDGIGMGIQDPLASSLSKWYADGHQVDCQTPRTEAYDISSLPLR